MTLPTGRTLTAQILRDAGTFVQQALVRVYRRQALDGGPDRALLVGQDVSDDNGVVRILIPQQQ
jgi:hypothetical protein